MQKKPRKLHGGDIYRHPDVIDFSVNTNPLGTPESVKRAVQESVAKIEHYPDVRCEALREAISRFEQVNMEEILCGNGAAEVIFTLCGRAFFRGSAGSLATKSAGDSAFIFRI